MPDVPIAMPRLFTGTPPQLDCAQILLLRLAVVSEPGRDVGEAGQRERDVPGVLEPLAQLQRALEIGTGILVLTLGQINVADIARHACLPLSSPSVR